MISERKDKSYDNSCCKLDTIGEKDIYILAPSRKKIM